jgi:hypothetical protein
MNNLQKRFALFLIGCMGIRTLFAYIAKKYVNYLPYFGYIATIPAIGFAYIYFTNSRKTGMEVFGGKIWWNSLRIIHSILYALFAYNAIFKNTMVKNTNAWKFLALDVIVGLTGFVMYHSNLIQVFQ